jgi:hypothetical protein
VLETAVQYSKTTVLDFTLDHRVAAAHKLHTMGLRVTKGEIQPGKTLETTISTPILE